MTPRFWKSATSFVLGALFLSGSAVFGDSDADAIRLSRHLGVSEDTTYRPTVKPTLPDSRPLRVALAFGLDMGVFRNFLRWTEEDWNRKKDARKHGPIELVDDIESAEVILVRFADREREVGASTATSGRAMALPLGKNPVVVGNTSDYEESMIPVQAYILKRTSSGYTVLGGYKGVGSMNETSESGEVLWIQFKDLMKKRPEQEGLLVFLLVMMMSLTIPA